MGNGRFRFGLSEPGFAAVRTDGQAAVTDALTPWFDWVESNHAGDLAVMFDTVDENRVPRLDATAVDLIELRTQQFLAAASD